VLRQLVELIPAYLVPKLARKFGVDKRARTFSAFSHVVALIYAQLNHALSLNDICDGLRLMATPLRALRGASPPSRNALSHANKVRDCALAETLFWEVLGHLQRSFPAFQRGAAPRLVRRFRRSIHIIDSTVIELVSSCVDWANHNRRKAAIKCHLRLSLQSLLPTFAFLSSARENDVQHVRRLCTGLRRGEVMLCDRGFHLLAHFFELTQRGVFFVTRAREDVLFKVVKRCAPSKDSQILSDEYVVTTGAWVEGHYPEKLRRVTARVLVDGKECVLTFLTNNFTWSARSIADLFRCRWQIEAFFKQIKQTLQLADFLGQNANAVKWQIWIALLVFVLLRFQAWCSDWPHSFSRLFTLLRAALWLPRDVGRLLRHGTANGDFRYLENHPQSWLPGFLV
jgi:Transposase DDE domain.